MTENKENKENNKNIHCPKCGGELRKIGRETVGKVSGIIEYDTYCDKCNTTVNIEDRSKFERLDKVFVIFA